MVLEAKVMIGILRLAKVAGMTLTHRKLEFAFGYGVLWFQYAFRHSTYD